MKFEIDVDPTRFICFACFKPANVFCGDRSFCKRCWEFLGWYDIDNNLVDGNPKTEFHLFNYLHQIGEIHKPIK